MFKEINEWLVAFLILAIVAVAIRLTLVLIIVLGYGLQDLALKLFA